MDAIHEFGKADNRYLMSVGETKGRQVEEVLRKHKAKVCPPREDSGERADAGGSEEGCPRCMRWRGRWSRRS